MSNIDNTSYPKAKIKVLFLENISEVRTFWEKYQNPFEKVFERSYDQYLKVNQQQAGIQSYSLVVDLLVDDFINQ